MEISSGGNERVSRICQKCRTVTEGDEGYCRVCGVPISTNQGGAADPSGCLKQVLMLAVVLAVLSWGWSACTGETEADRKIGATVGCEMAIDRQLKAPSSSSYTPYRENELADGRWEIGGYVDAENSFGAKIRGDYYCIVEDQGDYWVATTARLESS